MTFWYRLCWWLVRIAFAVWHPVYRVVGKNMVPPGKVIFCANHSGMADPLWILLALNGRKILRIMAKDELRTVPVIGWILKKFDIIFVRRGQHDTEAYEKSLKAVQNGEQMLLFIEGTRCNGDKHVRAKTGAVRLAIEGDAPLLPVFVTRNRKPFCPVTVTFGQPYAPEKADVQDHDAMQRLADETLRKIYTLGGDEYADHIGEERGLLLRS